MTIPEYELKLPQVKLVSYSQEPDIYRSRPGGGTIPNKTLQEIIAYCARVSNPKNQDNNETSEKLIDYLIKHEHWSPFEMVNVCVEVKTTRDIGRQILRHWSFRFQEYSQRYGYVTFDDFVLRAARLQDPKNRQNSIKTDDEEIIRKWKEMQSEVINLAVKYYNMGIEMGLAKEQVRSILPEGNTVSTMYINADMRSWIHYVRIRSSKGVQEEHRMLAIKCGYVIGSVIPKLVNFIDSEKNG